MKLHLPTVLLATVLACISQPVIATETINLNTHNWDQYIGDDGNPGYPRFDNVNLSLNGNWSVNFDKFYDLTWGASDNGSYTLTGQGTMDSRTRCSPYLVEAQKPWLQVMPNIRLVPALFSKMQRWKRGEEHK